MSQENPNTHQFVISQDLIEILQTKYKINCDTIIHKVCNGCQKHLSTSHLSQKCRDCPTIYDQCKDCQQNDPDRKICYKNHETLEEDNHRQICDILITLMPSEYKKKLQDKMILQTPKEDFIIYDRDELRCKGLLFSSELFIDLFMLVSPPIIIETEEQDHVQINQDDQDHHQDQEKKLDQEEPKLNYEIIVTNQEIEERLSTKKDRPYISIYLGLMIQLNDIEGYFRVGIPKWKKDFIAHHLQNCTPEEPKELRLFH